ncbi:hypothetical protein CO726_00700 [Bacillus fungorum]|uniref:Uncharacterized protein n=1 Tax=Bacillus fungorum TaxID=2039284 RepID=A0A2G6QKB2_9BACI|nr:hypothetical protein CO726_00700 [Bacillus fungorum]
MQYFHRDLAPTQSLLIHSYFHASLIGISLLTICYPALTGRKTPTSKFSENKEVRWRINCP